MAIYKDEQLFRRWIDGSQATSPRTISSHSFPQLLQIVNLSTANKLPALFLYQQNREHVLLVQTCELPESLSSTAHPCLPIGVQGVARPEHGSGLYHHRHSQNYAARFRGQSTTC